jgi:hypothetical protein
MLRLQYSLRLEEAETCSPICERIAAVIKTLDAERLLHRLDAERGSTGRDDYPNRSLWHCLVAFGCLGVKEATAGLRFLELSAELRQLCGMQSKKDVPSKHAFYRFEKRLLKQLDLLEEMFAALVRQLSVRLPGFGQRLATDSTKVHSLANGKKRSADPDASWKKYEHVFLDEKGIPRQAAVKWFGYKLHLLVDAVYELPIAAFASTARDNDYTHFPTLWDKAKANLPELKHVAKSNALDKGYDETNVHQLLWADGVAPIIPLRNLTEKENQVLLPEHQQVCPRGEALRFDGFESARQALRYDRPASCPKVSGRGYCELSVGCRQNVSRVKIGAETVRHLGPVPRDSKQFQRLYRGRTAVERVNSRLKEHWGLDCVRRRGLGRVKIWAMLSLLCMNAFAATMAEKGFMQEVRKTVYSLAA